MPGIEEYFRGLLVVEGDEYWVSRILDRVGRWFFDLLKNMLTVGLLLAIADRTGSAPLKILGQIATGMLLVTAMAPTRGWHLDPLHPLKSEPISILGAVTIKLLIGGVAIALIYFEIRPALDAFAGWNEK
jgi:fructose-specific phosphotransferase system IIC component